MSKEDEWCHYSGMPSPNAYKETKTKMSKMGRYILEEQEKEIANMNKHRQVKDSVYKNEDTSSKENKFLYCHIGEHVTMLQKHIGNDQEFGAKVREFLLSVFAE